MKEAVRTQLQALGNCLDACSSPMVYNQGVIRPATPVVVTTYAGQEKTNAAGSSQRPSTRPWQRTARWQGSPGQSRTPDSGAPVVDAGLRRRYEAGIGACLEAYPSLLSFRTDQRMWLFFESALLDNLDRTAAFAVRLPFNRQEPCLAWGFWKTAVSRTWIGPRHTNFPDGSICAFDPMDGTWDANSPLITLLDLYSIWAAKHLHFELLGRWPGLQSVPHAAERVLELQSDEYCGCGKAPIKYKDCCMVDDRRSTSLDEIASFRSRLRSPPKHVLDFIWSPTSAPTL